MYRHFKGNNYKEINVLVNMQGKRLSIMLLCITLRQTRTWTEQEQENNTKQGKHKQTNNDTDQTNQYI